MPHGSGLNCGYPSGSNRRQGGGMGMGEFITCGTMFHGGNNPG